MSTVAQTRPLDSMASPDTAVLLMAHGTPDSLDQMPEYLTRVRNGRLPSQALIDEIRANYAAIGGRSPLTDITHRQAAALRELLGPDVQVLVGMRNWKPLIGDVLGQLFQFPADRAAVGSVALNGDIPASNASGIGRVVGIPLAPQFSTLSVQKYIEVAEAAIPPGVRFECVKAFHDHPLLVQAFAERVREARPDPDECVVFTAHSLPVRVVQAGDPYANQVAATAAAVARCSGVVTYERAWQSAGRTPEPWLGPDVGELIRQRAAAGVRRFLVVPIGFVCDHTEVLFDIDVQAAGVARACGARLRRTQSLNQSPTFIRLLAALVHETLKAQES